MLKSNISFSLLYWISYLLWIYSQISSNSWNFVFSIIILENLRKSLWIMRNQNNEKIETHNWTRLLIFDDKINFYFIVELFLHFMSSLFNNFKNMSYINTKEIFHNTAYSVQLPYIAGHFVLRSTKTRFFLIHGNYLFAYIYHVYIFLVVYDVSKKHLETAEMVEKNFLWGHSWSWPEV